MRNILLIARREYLEQVRGRAFKTTTIGLPAVFAAIGRSHRLPLQSRSGRQPAHGRAASDPALAGQIRSQLLGDKEAKASVDVIAPATPEQRAALVNMVRTKALDGLLWVDTPAGAAPTAPTPRSLPGDFITNERLKSALNHALAR
jgi:ABC-2 type transport system permease protein